MLRIDELYVSYGRVAASRGLSLDVGEGEIVALVGANGAGKSTVLRAISGLARPTSGTIEFQGKRIERTAPAAIVRAGISHCPEERKIWPAMSILEHLELGAYARRGGQDVADSMERVFAHFPVLKERRDQMAGTLSGGEQQMLAVGRALMSAPRLMLLDEPSLGLSPLLVAELAKVIHGIHSGGVAVLLVEQNVRMALTVARRAYVLETGRSVMEGTSEDLLGDDSLVRAYLGG